MARLITGIAAAIAALACAAPAAAQSPYPDGPYAPWDGANPFNCVLQDAGFGTVVPDPDADPYCVEFDKTEQNLTDSGLLEFLTGEPARVSAAGPKCFYFQSDHWTGSVVQGQPPELWHWDGQYFFDKALGVGGVNVQNFRVGGQPASPSAYGEVPPEMAPYMDQDGGGAYIIGDIDADPACVARVDTPAERAQIYADGVPPPLPNAIAATAASPIPAWSSRPRSARRSAPRSGRRPSRASAASSARRRGSGGASAASTAGRRERHS